MFCKPDNSMRSLHSHPTGISTCYFWVQLEILLSKVCQVNVALAGSFHMQLQPARGVKLIHDICQFGLPNWASR